MTHLRRKVAAVAAVVAALPLALSVPALAAGSSICAGATCSQTEVGPFMVGISRACGNEGTCSLADIETVIANVGNWVLGVVGALVLLAYVVGGFYFLLSGMPGMEKYREKGKTALKQSTVGLVIVFVAYAGLTTLKSVLTGGGISPEANYVVCGPGSTNAGQACDLNSTCNENGRCVSKCEALNVGVTSTSGTVSVGIGVDVQATVVSNLHMCVDVNAEATNYGLPSNYYLTGGFQEDLCPGGDNIQCGTFELFTD